MVASVVALLVVVASIVVAGVVGRGVRVVVAAIMMRMVVVVIIIPNVNSVAAVFVAPLHFGLEMGPLSVLVSLDCVIRIAPSVTELPGSGIRHAGIPVCEGEGESQGRKQGKRLSITKSPARKRVICARNTQSESSQR